MAEKADFSGVAWGSVEWTMLCTLYLRAYEYRSGHTVLGDRAAAEAVDRISYDFPRMKRWLRPAGNQFLVALRARRFDIWAADFIRRHPDAVVLHLGCGLDSRVFRLDPPDGVDWFDVDTPDVIAMRRKIFDERDGYRMIGSSVTEPGWLAEIAEGRPALVVAEGLLPYLTAAEVRTLLDRITTRFGVGELMFDGLPRWVVRMSKIQHWGVRDGREIERWNPRMRLAERTTPMADYAHIPARLQRWEFRMFNAMGPMGRSSQSFRFTF
jgi:O-methyltransferase involved in polyketide biosynthesis